MSHQKDPNNYSEFVSLWARRSAVLKEMESYDLQKKDLTQRLKSISYFNGLFEEALDKSAAEHQSSGLLEYTRLIAKIARPTSTH